MLSDDDACTPKSESEDDSETLAETRSEEKRRDSDYLGQLEGQRAKMSQRNIDTLATVCVRCVWRRMHVGWWCCCSKKAYHGGIPESDPDGRNETIIIQSYIPVHIQFNPFFFPA